MTYVVTEACIACKHTSCVPICPVDCFHEGPNFVVIDPDTCINCGLCEIECPVEAIVAEADLPANQLRWRALNAELSRIWPVIAEKRDMLPNALEMADVVDKEKLLIRETSLQEGGM